MVVAIQHPFGRIFINTCHRDRFIGTMAITRCATLHFYICFYVCFHVKQESHSFWMWYGCCIISYYAVSHYTMVNWMIIVIILHKLELTFSLPHKHHTEAKWYSACQIHKLCTNSIQLKIYQNHKTPCIWMHLTKRYTNLKICTT